MSETPSAIPHFDPEGRQRLDKWLWAARFFKTRSQAQVAIDGGKVKLNGHPSKTAREVKAGDQLEITLGQSHWSVTVVAVNPYRRPAEEARQLYLESPESKARRAQEDETRHLAPAPGQDMKGRPTKRDRRQMQRFSG